MTDIGFSSEPLDMKKVNRNFADKRTVLENEWMELLLNTTNKCNINSCLTCPHKYRKFGTHASKELIQRISPFLQNVDKIYLHGFGEPLANPDFIFFLRQAKYANPNIYTSVFTNGTLLKKCAHELIENGLDEVLISLDASNEELYREIRQVDFDKVLSGIKELRGLSSEIKIHITMVLTKKNVYDIFNFIELAKELRVDGVGLMNMYIFDDLPPEVKDLYLLDDENWKKVIVSIIKQAKKICQDYNLSFTYPPCFDERILAQKEKIFCNHPFGFFIQIDVDGGVLPCCGGYNGAPLGNVFDQSLEEIWNGRDYQELRKCIIENRIYDGCRNCELYKFKEVNEPQINENIFDALLICPTCGCSLEHRKIAENFSKNYSALDVKAEDEVVKKIGNWTITENYNALSKSLVMSNTTGDTLSYSFKGKLAAIYFLRHDWSGIAEIYLDGEFLESLDLFCEFYDYGFDYTVEAEEDGEHTIDIVVSGKKDPKSIDCQIWVDGFGTFRYKFDEIYICETCNTSYPVIDGVVDFTQPDDVMVKEYNAFFTAGGDDVYEFEKNPEITKIGHFLKLDVLDSLIHEDISDKTVVDVGCGSWGFACIFPKLQGCKTGIGLDISLTALRESRKKLSNYYYVASNQRVPLANNSTDIVFAGEVVEHVVDPVRLIEEVHQVLKPNGIFILTTPNADAFFYQLMGKRYAESSDHISLQNYKSLKSLLAGKFVIEQEKGVNLSIYPSIDRRIRNKILLKGWSRIFLNHPKYATGSILKCRKIG